MKPHEPTWPRADFVEVRFDRLYLKKPEAERVEDENGEVKHVMPPDNEWPVRDGQR